MGGLFCSLSPPSLTSSKWRQLRRRRRRHRRKRLHIDAFKEQFEDYYVVFSWQGLHSHFLPFILSLSLSLFFFSHSLTLLLCVCVWVCLCVFVCACVSVCLRWKGKLMQGRWFGVRAKRQEGNLLVSTSSFNFPMCCVAQSKAKIIPLAKIIESHGFECRQLNWDPQVNDSALNGCRII